MDFQTSALILSWIVIILLALAVSGIMRQVRLLSAAYPRGQQLSSTFIVGKPAPLLDHVEFAEKTAVLLFAAPDCESCLARLAELDSVASLRPDAQFVAVFSGESGDVSTRHLKVLENQESSFKRFGVAMTPFGVAVSREGVVARVAPLGSSGALEQFLAGTASLQ